MSTTAVQLQPLTKEQKANLHKATDLAVGFGKCRYIGEEDGKPRCVIAQLLIAVHGIADAFNKPVAEGTSIHGCMNHNMGEPEAFLSPAAIEVVNSYGPVALQFVQQIWDSGEADGYSAWRDVAEQFAAALGYIREKLPHRVAGSVIRIDGWIDDPDAETDARKLMHEIIDVWPEAA